MSASLQFHPRRKAPFHRLPFVGQQADGTPYFWNVPLTGGYYGGPPTGGELAALRLIHLRQHRRDQFTTGQLGQVATAWLDAARTASPEQYSALRGQVLGFMAMLSPWLIAAEHNGRNLDSADRHALLRKANQWLAFDDSTLFADQHELTAPPREG
jgi:hypothetical protein